jgi:LCP family protein required for cell wall assembly
VAGPPDRLGWGSLRRPLLGAALIVLLAAGTTITVAFLEVGKVAQALRTNRTIQVAPDVLAPASAGEPQTLLLVGDDRRPPPKGRPTQSVAPHSNEMLLVRLDPSKPTISMLSIPRDLRETIYPPDRAPVTNRINVAYTLGGIQLMTQTIKRVLNVKVNHVVVMTFPRFKRAVDEMGCVYSTIDRRYFHSNATGGEQYFEIDLRPGYQRLCGDSALQFVAYRHGDTALIRDARDQRFLLDVKAQYGPTLVSSRDKFEQVFGKAVQTDIHGTGQVLDLLALLVGSAGKPVRQVHFQANVGPREVTASQQQIERSVSEFMRGVAPIVKSQAANALRLRSQLHRPRPPGSPRRQPAGLSLRATPKADLAAARSVAHRLPFALEYPRVRNQLGTARDSIRRYGIRDGQGRVHQAYVVVIDRGSVGEYYDVQGTGWQDPPLLQHPDQTVKVGSRTYGLFYEGSKLRIVGWREGPAVYWISNSLVDGVPPRELLAMAEQTVPVLGGRSVVRAQTRPRSFTLPPRRGAASATGPEVLAGAILGLLAIVGVGLLSVRLFRRARELDQLREDCREMARIEDLERSFARRPAVRAAALRAPGDPPVPERPASPPERVP